MITVKKFSASWCGPCKQLAPIFEQLKREVSGVSFQEIDVDSNRTLVESANVRSVPTVIIERDGKEVRRISGVQSLQFFKSTIDSLKS